jgi:hypothetical protein
VNEKVRQRWLRAVCRIVGHDPRAVIIDEEVAIRTPPGLIETVDGTIFGMPTVAGTYSRFADGTWARRENSNGQRMIQCRRCRSTLYHPSPDRWEEPTSVTLHVRDGDPLIFDTCPACGEEWGDLDHRLLWRQPDPTGAPDLVCTRTVRTSAR